MLHDLSVGQLPASASGMSSSAFSIRQWNPKMDDKMPRSDIKTDGQKTMKEGQQKITSTGVISEINTCFMQVKQEHSPTSY